VTRTRVKFCGLTRPGDVRLACELGVDALGFVLAHGSPRQLSAAQLGGLRAAVSPLVQVVALFRDTPASEVLDTIHRLRPTLLQFHGREDDAFCRGFGIPFVKALPMGGAGADAVAMSRHHPSAVAFLLDGHAPGEGGGRGMAFDWSLAPRLQRPVFLAGGLAADNVGRAIAIVRPYAVDVSSGIESAPGCKDGEKMQQFLDEVRRADEQ
jgi:phosphoribosylanthranilate isomerase